MDDEINNNHNQNENEANINPEEFFKVTPDDYTESDSNTIIDFDEEEDSKIQNDIIQKNQVPNNISENHEEYASNEDNENPENIQHEEQGFEEQNHEDEHENKNEEMQDKAGNHPGDEQNNNGEEQQKDEENQEENEEEENGITDPNVKQLMKMDLADKEGIIELLMKDNIIKKTDVKNEKVIKEKNRSKFEYVESTIGKKPIGNKKTSYGRTGFHLTSEEGNPEFIKDMNIAANVIKDKIVEENQDIAKILFDENSSQKISKRISREQIDEKVKKTLEKKKKNLEKIEAKIYEHQKIEETFTPVINHRKGENKERRNLNKFLDDQKNFSQKVKQKRENLINQKEEKSNKEIVGKPKVDKNSEELAKKLNNTEKPAYKRLYEKRKLKEEKIAETEKMIKQKRTEEANKRKEKMNENKKLYGHIQSKINMGQKKEEQNYDKNVENKKNKEMNENDKEKEKIFQKKIKKKKGKLLDVKDIQTNKMLFNNFEKKFEEVLESFTNDSLSETEFHDLLFNLGMVSSSSKIDEENNERKKEENDEDKNEDKVKKPILEESLIQQDEKKLINEIINTLKDEQGKINKENIKDFLTSIIGLQKYEFYQRYKKEHEPELKELLHANKYKKEEIPELIIKKRNQEILTKVEKNNPKNNKYAYKTNDGKIYISLEKGHAIKKDFNRFALNYRNSKRPSKDINKLLKERKEFSFKPTINENSEKLYQKFKNSVQNEEGSGNSQGKDPHMEYIDRILIHDKKRIAENQKAKEQLEKEQLKECTFKPKINQQYLSKKEKEKNETDNNNKEKKNRMVELYEKGIADIKKKKNRTKEEMEVEKQIKELTFHPRTKKEEVNIETKFSNDIYNEKEYKDLYERLKIGRMERLVKDSAHDRYDLNKDLKKFVKQSKENKNREFLEEEKYQDELIESANIIKTSKKNEKNQSNKKNGNKNEEVSNNSFEPSSEDEGEKKEGIPLLIIDVNIRQGVKKKIYVYEGDTPEGLAEKFAKEHKLEKETKNKLQNLIHNHMLRLLTRIEEENQSISEKSHTTHNNKK